MTPLAQRFLYGTPLLAVVVGLLAWDRASGRSIGVALLAAIFSFGAIIEFTRIFRLGPRLAAAALALVVGLLSLRAGELVGDSALPRHPARLALPLALIALVPGLLVILHFRSPPSAEALRRSALALFGALWVGLPMLALIELATATEWGVGWLLFLVLVVKGNDIGAFLTGRWRGRTPLTQISPKKTREGAIGGLAYGIAAAIALVLLDADAPLGTLGGAGLALVVGTAGQLGDLVESYLKRAAGVKDSGALIPAFGGILDLLDSILLAGPLLLLAALLVEG